MKCAYPPGPIQGKELLTSLRNINQGMDWTAKLREWGFSPFPVCCDYADIMRTKGVTMEGENGVYEMSLSWMRKADCMFMLPGWANSRGARAERLQAQALRNPVFYHDALEDFLAWGEG